jgi:hypothetical protein
MRWIKSPPYTYLFLLYINIKHPIGFEPIIFDFEDRRFNHWAKDATIIIKSLLNEMIVYIFFFTVGENRTLVS